MTAQARIAYSEGREAAINGKWRASNPYADSDLALAASWLSGYESVQATPSYERQGS